MRRESDGVLENEEVKQTNSNETKNRRGDCANQDTEEQGRGDGKNSVA